ncbi:hypothetical protein [Tomitella fengzijianii]|uniref:Uncharacterized protein n=1 Tax=Tomitella fengzijianii TaxID=2597660 RepID=A0A516X5M9_9ACTN|nr:hypothetical protein [Tomitella fengzijianii]QDQ98340.1 hypothetical protein FO059_14740 [Tomitella fengzijianii]
MLERAVAMIDADTRATVVSSRLDDQPGYLRIVYRRADDTRLYGFRADALGVHRQPENRRVPAVGAIAEDIAAAVGMTRSGNGKSARPIRDGGVLWWGDGYPHDRNAPVADPDDTAGFGALTAGDARAWSQWHAGGLTPVTDTAAADWLTRSAFAAGRAAGNPATVRLSNPDDPDDFDGFAGLPDAVLAAVTAALSRATTTPAACWYAVQEGTPVTRSDHAGTFAFYATAGAPAPPSPPSALPTMFLDGPRATIGVGHCKYVLFAGPAGAAPNMGWSPTPTSFCRQWPDLTWPDDRAWLAEYETYDNVLDITGPVSLIEALSSIPGVDAERVR